MSANEHETDAEKIDPLPRRKWLLAGIPVCVVMAAIEIARAFDGNARSIAYAFEWPFFGGFLYYMYWRLGPPLPTWDEDDEGPSAPQD